MAEMEKTQAPAKNPWEEMEQVFIPMRTRTEQPTKLVKVNMRTFRVPKGKSVWVPRPVAEVIRNAEEIQRVIYEEAREGFGGEAVPTSAISLDKIR